MVHGTFLDLMAFGYKPGKSRFWTFVGEIDRQEDGMLNRLGRTGTLSVRSCTY